MLRKVANANIMRQKFLSFEDSLGNVLYFDLYDGQYDIDNITKSIRLRSGDTYTIRVNVDPCFDSSNYMIKWHVTWALTEIAVYETRELTVSITDMMVGNRLKFSCKVTSNKNWHRHGSYDDYMWIELGNVLPPIEENY